MSRVLAAALLVVAACAGVSREPGQDPNPAPSADPSTGEVPLDTLDAGWNARLLLDNGAVGVWTVRALPVFPQYASPEVVGLDDLGRCHVLVSYSGKWTDLARVGDGEWLGGLAHGDVDPRRPGAELYTGGKRGNLYQLNAHPQGALDARLIAHLPGRELHTLLAGDLDPRSPGAEVLVFTRPGALYRVSPTGPDGDFETTLLEELPGRVRDAALLPGEPPTIATVSRAGRLSLLTIGAQGPRWEVIHQAPMGMGRIAVGAGGRVLYTTLDDGRVLRHERVERWESETIYAGPQGPRGIAAGRFVAEDGVEALAVFGYSGRVQLLSRRGAGPWEVRDLFADRGRGHWLAVAELDGRNGTRELIGSGYGARIFMLARPPGYGSPGVRTDAQ